MIKIEYAVIVNEYAGCGDECKIVTTNYEEAINEKAFYDRWLEKGTCRIDYRFVSDFQQLDIKHLADILENVEVLNNEKN